MRAYVCLFVCFEGRSEIIYMRERETNSEIITLILSHAFQNLVVYGFICYNYYE